MPDAGDLLIYSMNLVTQLRIVRPIRLVRRGSERVGFLPDTCLRRDRLLGRKKRGSLVGQGPFMGVESVADPGLHYGINARQL